MEMSILQLLRGAQIRMYVIVECCTDMDSLCIIWAFCQPYLEKSEMQEMHVAAFILDAKEMLRATLGAVFRDRSSCIA